MGSKIRTYDDEGNLQCTSCLGFFPVNTYRKRKNLGPNAIYRNCTNCLNIKDREWREDNKWKVEITRKNYEIIHREERNEKKRKKAKESYGINPMKYLEYMRTYSKEDAYKENRRRHYREGFEIGDIVLYNGVKYKILKFQKAVGYTIFKGRDTPIVVSRKSLTRYQSPF